jgi:hypothetical protein
MLHGLLIRAFAGPNAVGKFALRCALRLTSTDRAQREFPTARSLGTSPACNARRRANPSARAP